MQFTSKETEKRFLSFTENRIQWGFLTDEEQTDFNTFVNLGATPLVCEPTPGRWTELKYPAWGAFQVYRLALPTTKPSINWDHVADHFEWLTESEGGVSFLYSIKPQLTSDSWEGTMRSKVALASNFASYTPGTCHWTDSLVQRPQIKES